MSTSAVFEWVGAALQEQTTLPPAQARGMLRLALRDGGLDAAAVTSKEMAAVLDRLLPDRLRKGGVADPANVCLRLSIGLKAKHFDADGATGPRAEEFFHRVLGGRGR